MVAKLKLDSHVCIHLNFEACVTKDNIDDAPQRAGIYVAFVCKKLVDRDGYYVCSRIAYIGKAEGSDNLRKRIQQHFDMDHKRWTQLCQLSSDETFVYAYAIFEDSRLADVESALIYENQPVANVQHNDKYNGNSWILWITCEGNIGMLNPWFSVVRYI